MNLAHKVLTSRCGMLLSDFMQKHTVAGAAAAVENDGARHNNPRLVRCWWDSRMPRSSDKGEDYEAKLMTAVLMVCGAIFNNGKTPKTSMLKRVGGLAHARRQLRVLGHRKAMPQMIKLVIVAAKRPPPASSARYILCAATSWR